MQGQQNIKFQYILSLMMRQRDFSKM